jgi:hypothetical protein
MCFAWMLQDQSQGVYLDFKGLFILRILWMLARNAGAAGFF